MNVSCLWKKRLTLLAIFLFFNGSVQSFAAQEPVSKELLRLQKTTPEKEFGRNKKTGKYNFLGLNGYTLDVPGVVGGQFNSIVRFYKISVIDGTSDVIKNPEHLQAQNYAHDFAAEYNKNLIQFLVKYKLSAPKNLVMAEVRKIETSDIKSDLHQAINKRDFRFVKVFGLKGQAPGIPMKDRLFVKDYGEKIIGVGDKEAKKLEANQLQSIARIYASEYNYLLLQHLRSNNKLRK